MYEKGYVMLNLKVSEERTARIHKDVRETLQKFPNAILGGGAVRDAAYNNKIEDYDMFFKDRETMGEVAAWLDGERGYRCVFACPQGQLFTYKSFTGLKVQLIGKRFYTDAEDLLDTFDFNATRFATTGDCTVFVTDRAAIKDIKTMVLSLHNLEFPKATVNRLYKYRNKGYYVGHIIGEILTWVNQLDDYDADEDAIYVD